MECLLWISTSQGFSSGAQQRVYYFAAVETTAPNWFHLHALLAGTKNLGVRDLTEAWRSGFAQVRVYDPTRGAANYVTKTMGGTLPPDYSFDLPPRLAQDLFLLPKEPKESPPLVADPRQF